MDTTFVCQHGSNVAPHGRIAARSPLPLPRGEGTGEEQTSSSASSLPRAAETTRAPRAGARGVHERAGRKAERAGSARVHSLAAHGASSHSTQGSSSARRKMGTEWEQNAPLFEVHFHKTMLRNYLQISLYKVVPFLPAMGLCSRKCVQNAYVLHTFPGIHFAT